ncbi:MAG TPA: hypothetical protein VF442_04820 [Sphingobium sp.]
MDAEGNIVPLPYGEMSEEQQAVHDLKSAQKEQADARAALLKAQKENAPGMMQMAQARIETARQNAATAAQRLGLQQDQFEANFMGTHHGEALPGAPADEAGNPIGVRTAAVTKPTAQVQGRAAQGAAIKEAGDSLIREIDQKSRKVGNLESYWHQFTNGTPISDPDTAGLMTSLASFAALQPALHGFRGASALKEFEKTIGGVPKNPEALKAAIRSIQGTAGIVQKGGTVHTVAPKGAGAPAVGTVEGGYRFKGGDPSKQENWEPAK